MKVKLREDKGGNILVLVSVLLPVLLACIGMCLDGSLLIYYQSRLMTATKIAAVSASSDYEIDDKGNTKIRASSDFVKDVLKENFKEAKLRNFTINESAKNKCTVEAEVEVNFTFMKIFNINSKTISESYTAERN